MSKYSKYGKELDELMRQRFSDFEKAEEAYKKAKKAHEEHPVRTGWGVTHDDHIKAMKYQVAFEEAKKTYDEALKVFREISSEARAIRSALYDDLQKDFAVNPEDLERNVVDILASGVCTTKEVKDLFDNAGNATTKRYIAQYAKKADVSKMSPEEASVYRNITHEGQLLHDPDSHDAMKKFDVALDVVDRCTKNTALIGYWGQLTEAPLSEM